MSITKVLQVGSILYLYIYGNLLQVQFSDCVRPTVHRLSINHASKSVSMSASKRVDQIAGHLNYPKGMLAGQVAIITGSGQGIGAECARLFANEGAKVIVADVDASTSHMVPTYGQGRFSRYQYTNTPQRRPRL